MHQPSAMHWSAIKRILRYLKGTLNHSLFLHKHTQYMHQPSAMHWSTVKWILWYLKGTLNRDLFLHKHTSLHLHAFANVDWVKNFDDRTSMLGYIIFFGSNPISWSSKKQKTIARRSWISRHRYHCCWTQLGYKSPQGTQLQLYPYSYNILWQCWSYLLMCQSSVLLIHETHCHQLSLRVKSSCQTSTICLLCTYDWSTSRFTHEASHL